MGIFQWALQTNICIDTVKGRVGKKLQVYGYRLPVRGGFTSEEGSKRKHVKQPLHKLIYNLIHEENSKEINI